MYSAAFFRDLILCDSVLRVIMVGLLVLSFPEN